MPINCNSIDCGLLRPPENGNVNYPSGRTSYGSVAEFSCNLGFSLVGQQTVICQSSGSWNGNTPTCQMAVAGKNHDNQ